jgi:hypothetical protein
MIDGVTPAAYHLPDGERLNEAASRSWNRLLGVWASFQSASVSLKETDPATGQTREKWLFPLFQELGYGRVQSVKAFDIDGKAYPISHVWGRSPIHLVGRGVDRHEDARRRRCGEDHATRPRSGVLKPLGRIPLGVCVQWAQVASPSR